MIINLSYDSSVASAPIGFKTSLNSLVSFLQTTFTDPVTLDIAVGYGEVAGTATSSLGASRTYVQTYSYSQLESALTADATSATDNSANASLPATNPLGSSSYRIATAEAKALGLLSSTTNLDGNIGFGSSYAFDYDRSNGISSGQYDFYAVAAHEITEVMGRHLWGGSPGYTALDLFHFSAPGVRTFSMTTPGYFSTDNGVTNLDNFNTNSGGDYGDWAASAGNDAFLAFTKSGVLDSISNTDLEVMDVLGWDRGIGGTSGPDLIVSNAAATASGITYTVNNAGGTMAGASVTKVYLSADAVITGGDTLLATNSTPSLAPASGDNESASFVLPSNLSAAGTYYLGVLADSTNVVTEAKESNNSAALPVILGNGGDNSLSGTSSGDSLWGFAGNDSLNGGAGKDFMAGGIGNDIYYVDSTGDVVTENAGEGTDSVRSSVSFTLGATVENLTLTGSAAIKGTGNAAANTITGNSGANSLTGFGGADALDGGLGVDTAIYSGSPSGVNVSLVTGIGTGGDAQGDTLSNFENVTGSSYADTIEGNSGNNVLKGGSGSDTLTYVHATAGVAINLALTTAQITGGSATDTISSFENLTGSDFNDSLTGSTGANVLNGGNGNDVIDGGSGADKLLGGNGNDSLTGGAGADILTGGLNADRFILRALGDSPVGSGGDHVADFHSSETDKIDLSAIDANTIAAGDQSFAFIGNQVFHGVTGELHYIANTTGITVQGDVTGDGIADFAILVDGVASLAATDFIL